MIAYDVCLHLTYFTQYDNFYVHPCCYKEEFDFDEHFVISKCLAGKGRLLHFMGKGTLKIEEVSPDRMGKVSLNLLLEKPFRPWFLR